MKRILDVVVASIGLILFAPVLLVVAMLVRQRMGAPVLFRQVRPGLQGKPFRMIKFRSMRDGYDPAGNTLFDAERLTSLGRFLRASSLDELPELWNVLKGDMSIVGPRPPLRSEVEQYDESVGRRLLVKQGITGLWQVSGRSDLSWEDTVKLDLDYVENWSLVRDVQIIWRTLRAVLKSEGAY